MESTVKKDPYTEENPEVATEKVGDATNRVGRHWDLLGKSGAFGRGPIEQIETHISHIYLTSQDVFKFKKPLKWSFIDYSTLDKRRQACEREVKDNRRTAPGLYIGVVALRKDGSSFSLTRGEEIVDYAVHMKRFDEKTLFENLADTDGLSEPLISDLAEQIARFHMSAERTTEQGGIISDLEVVYDVATALRTHPDILDSAQVTAWETQLESLLQHQGTRIETRRRLGFVRHCHGDMHLSNICLFEGKPTLFDAIEFSDLFSDIDVMYDLAFPIMDLIHFGRRDLANVLLNRYLELTGDYSGLHLLPVFLSLRAAVRARVRAISEGKARGQASGYLKLAEELSTSSEPRLIAIGGLSGSGKSTLARHLVTKLANGAGAIHLRSDSIRKRLFNQPALIALPREAYAREVSERVYRVMCREAHRALSAGSVVIADATFIEEENRDMIEALAEKRGVPFQPIWLEAPASDMGSRIEARAGDVSDATNKVLASQLSKDLGNLTWARTDASGSIEDTVSKALDELN